MLHFKSNLLVAQTNKFEVQKKKSMPSVQRKLGVHRNKLGYRQVINKLRVQDLNYGTLKVS